MFETYAAAAARLLSATELARNVAPNEANLVYEIEKELEIACHAVGAAWVPFRMELALRRATGERRRLDVAHGAVIIEYEPPRSFNGGRSSASVRHARDQAEEYCELLAEMEGRARSEYVLVVWDGPHISFGAWIDDRVEWDALEKVSQSAMERLLRAIHSNGSPLVHPELLNFLVGPSSDLGGMILPAFFSAVIEASKPTQPTTKTKLLYVEWRRLFGQAVGVQTDAMRQLLRQLGDAHEQPYDSNHAAYLFALNTYIALVAKVTAALALPHASQNLRDPNISIRARMDELESGRLFVDAGITNMLNGDFFSWYVYDPAWSTYQVLIGGLVDRFRDVDFSTSRKSPESARDLFKGLYMSFAPRALRHALGEYYTPDWLAGHTLDQSGWKSSQTLLDPTCGSGTFILEALTRRLQSASTSTSAAELLSGLYGIDLNPIAVLSSRASIVISLGGRIDPSAPITIPVYLADAINPAIRDGDVYKHEITTEVGVREFAVPALVVESPDFHAMFHRVHDLVWADASADQILAVVAQEFALTEIGTTSLGILRATFETLTDLHSRDWNGIWATILADRFAAGAIPPVDVIAGNPPWVKWSHLPRQYVDLIGARCRALGVFSDDTWVGGIESDISTVVTYTALATYGKQGTVLAFLITGTVLSNESSQGFRRWRINKLDGLRITETEDFEVLRVEDFADVAPFEGVNNHTVLLLLQRRGKPTEYPVDYTRWAVSRGSDGKPVRTFDSAEAFRARSTSHVLRARPVPGTDAGPWLIGSTVQHDVWDHIFGRQAPAYSARKGVTTDANGIFFVSVSSLSDDIAIVSNDPSQGRRSDVPALSEQRVEAAHVFPLLRGAGVKAFRATVDPHHHVLVPQRDRNGDSDLALHSPLTHKYLARFADVLRSRSSYRRFQSTQAYWSLWSTGPYTFEPYKVLWREINGRTKRFAAAYTRPYIDPVLGDKVIIPDHKLYFVTCRTEAEAAYLTGILNAPMISEAIGAYAAQLSLGVSVVEYLLVPKYDPDNDIHRTLTTLSSQITNGILEPDDAASELDSLAARVFNLPPAR